MFGRVAHPRGGPMLRIAVFVDAGYLYALCCLSRFRVMYPRVRTSLDIDAVLRELKREVAALDGGGGRLIRIYWYDGAPKAGMTAEQLRTASAPDVKLRLGSVNSFGEQKGVDALIAHDLSELARNHAIDIALLVSGDEDILVGVQTAQTFGVRVHLLGIDPAHSQAPRLMQEADVCHEWPAGLVADWITGNAAGAPREASGAPDMHAVLAAIGTALDGQRESVIETWERETRIAPEIDRHLMKALSAQLGRTLRPQEKPSLRQAFIDALRG